MALGRFTAVTMALRKRYKERKGIKEDKPKHYLEKYVKDTQDLTKRLRNLRYRKYPYAVWFFGLMFMSMSITVLVFILLHRHLLFEEFDHMSLLGKYSICVGLFALGLFTFLTSEIYTLVINKRLGMIMQEKKSVLCKKRYSAHVLRDLKSITIVRKGHIARDTDTTNFMIEFIFEDGARMDTIHERTLRQIKKRYADITIYLERDANVDFSDVKYRDESTSSGERFKYRSPFDTSKQQEEGKAKKNYQEEENREFKERKMRFIEEKRRRRALNESITSSLDETLEGDETNRSKISEADEGQNARNDKNEYVRNVIHEDKTENDDSIDDQNDQIELAEYSKKDNIELLRDTHTEGVYHR